MDVSVRHMTAIHQGVDVVSGWEPLAVAPILWLDAVVGVFSYALMPLWRLSMAPCRFF